MSLLNRNSILTGSVDSFCLVCESHLRSDEDALLHVAKPIHRKNLDAVGFLDKFKEDHVRKVKKGYYCEYCNTLMTTAAKVGPHVADENHCTNKAKKPLKREGNGVLAFNKVFIPEYAWHGLIDDTCTVCDAEFDDPDIHKTGNAHVLKLVLIDIEFADENVYRKVDDSTFQCLTCNTVCAQKTMAMHFDTQEHINLYQLCCKAEKAKANEMKETSKSAKDDTQMKENEISKKEDGQKTLEKEKPQKPEVEKPKQQPKKELGTVMKQEVKNTIPKVHGANKDKQGKADQEFCKTFGAKEFVVRDITGEHWCILCDWSMDDATFFAHMQSKHHLTMLRLHQKRMEEKQIESDKELEENDIKEEKKLKMLGALKEFSKNNVMLNYVDSLAYCRVCSKNIDFEFDFIKNHIDEHKKKPAKAAKLENKPFNIGCNKSSQSPTRLLSIAAPMNDSESKQEKDSSARPKNDSKSNKKEKNSSAGPKNDSETKKEKDPSADPKNDSESKKEKDSSACPKNDSETKKETDASAGPKNDSKINKEKDSSAGPKNDSESKKEKGTIVSPKKDSKSNKKENDLSAGPKNDSESKKEDSSASPKNVSESKKEKDSSTGPKTDSESKKEKDSIAGPKNDSEFKKEESSVRLKKDSESKQEKDSSATCSTASKNDFDQEISSSPPKKSKKGKEKASNPSSVAPAHEGDSEIEIFSKLHDLNYNSNYNTAFCRICVSKIPPALKSLKEHVKGTSHKNKVAKVEVPNEVPVEKKPFCEFISSFSTVENTLVKDVVINEQLCLNIMSFFLLTRHGSKLRCQACEVNLTKTMVEAHKQSPRHERAMNHASVVMSEETEFIREIRPNIFHCGFCNLLESTWRNMESHLKSTTHRECKIAAYWRVQEYTPLLMQHRGRIRMEYVVFTRMLTEQLNSNE